MWVTGSVPPFWRVVRIVHFRLSSLGEPGGTTPGMNPSKSAGGSTIEFTRGPNIEDHLSLESAGMGG